MKPIRNRIEHQEAINRISELMDKSPAPNSNEDRELEELATLVETYEKKAFPQDLPDPLSATEFRMDQERAPQ